MGWLNDILKQEIKDAAKPAAPAAENPPSDDNAELKEILRTLIKEELQEALKPDTPPAEPPKQESEPPKEPESAPAKVSIAEQVKLAMADVLNKQPVKERPLEESYSRLFEG